MQEKVCIFQILPGNPWWIRKDFFCGEKKNEKKRKKVLTFLLGALSFACRKSTKAVRSSRTRFWVFPRLSDRAASFLPDSFFFPFLPPAGGVVIGLGFLTS